jgi:hypothetical protein
MAAGLGFKTFTTGEVLTAGDVNGYLMQGINVFASEAARNAAITSPQEGQFAFTKDNNSLWYYTGSAWAASGATGDIEGVTAGVGISGGGTSGTVTITNDMATTITAAGDIVVGTGSGTYDNLPIGTTGQILTADTTVSPYKVKWATPSSGTPAFVGASAYVSGTQSITGSTVTTVDFANEDYDTDGFHSTSSNTSRMTIPSDKAGKYLITGTLGVDSVPALLTRINVNGNAINGSIYTYYNAAGTGDANLQRIMLSFGAILNLAVADYVQLQVVQTAATARNLEAGRFDIVYLGA